MPTLLTHTCLLILAPSPGSPIAPTEVASSHPDAQQFAQHFASLNPQAVINSPLGPVVMIPLHISPHTEGGPSYPAEVHGAGLPTVPPETDSLDDVDI
eukprot:9412199-Prorocentrum_lima.AAC.1